MQNGNNTSSLNERTAESKRYRTGGKLSELDAKHYPFNLLRRNNKDSHTKEFYIRFGLLSESSEPK